MSKDELIYNVRAAIDKAVNFGLNTDSLAREIVNQCIEFGKNETAGDSIEQCVARIKQLTAKNNIGNVEIDLKF